MANKKYDNTNDTVPDINSMISKTVQEGGGDVIPEEKHVLNIEGGLTTVTAVPTTAPKKYSDNIVIYLDSLSSPTTKRLYVYSREGNLWNYVGLT
jgi:hypothetical protein